LGKWAEPGRRASSTSFLVTCERGIRIFVLDEYYLIDAGEDDCNGCFEGNATESLTGWIRGYTTRRLCSRSIKFSLALNIVCCCEGVWVCAVLLICAGDATNEVRGQRWLSSVNNYFEV